MPTYEYACIDCGTHIEVFQRISDDPLTTCGACGGRLRKVFHPAGILFKGSGFYRTDNRSSRPGSEKSTSDGGTEGDSKKAASGSTEKSGSTAGKPGDAAKGKSA